MGRRCHGTWPNRFIGASALGVTFARFIRLSSFALCLHVASLANADEPPLPELDLNRVHLDSEGATAPAGGVEASLTLDPELQRQGAFQVRAARPQQGAAVAIDVKTGRVLLWTESKKPGQDSLMFEAHAPAASVFKMVTTVALFERGHVDPKQRVCIDGGEHGIYRRHLDPATGQNAFCAPFFQALGYSRNAVYAQLVNHYLMRNDLIEIAEKIGFNGNVPFDVPVQLGTLVAPYNDLEFARTAAGFEETRLTPLGAAYLAYVVANRGLGSRISIVDHAGSYQGPKTRQDLDQVISTNSAWRLTRMMEVTVHSGTSLSAFSDERGRSYLRSVRVAGKTGTLRPTPKAPTTSWFVGFAPSRRPQIAIAVLLQNGAIWHRKANEVARDILRAYFAAQGVRGVTPP